MSIGFERLGDVVIRSGTSEIVPGSPRQRCVLTLLLIDVNRPVGLGDIHAERGEDAPGRAAWTTALSLHRRQGRSSAADRMPTNLSPDPRAD
ncbi:hypothetical protein ACFWVU_09435 [Streptomyces sp. NPDC058686]|uniref:hypothetical protein n=1 Tax=Streptomyces sp. NPDC058686 TaxID=3346599 RepID=UPI00364BB054